MCFFREIVTFGWHCVWIYEGQQRSWWFWNKIVKIHKHVLSTMRSHQSSHLSWKWSITIAITSAKSHFLHFWILSWMATVKGIQSILFRKNHKKITFLQKSEYFGHFLSLPTNSNDLIHGFDPIWGLWPGSGSSRSESIGELTFWGVR